MPWGTAIRRGLTKGMRTTWELMRIIVPVYVIVAILQETPVMDWLAVLFAPAMKFFGLPAEAAIALALGFVSGLYAALGAIATLNIGPKEILVLAVMLSFAHNLFVESAVTHRLGIPFRTVLALRLGLAAIGGWAVNLIV